ncbi:hypothetical protein JCM24511_00954 [Saitozyma sp. JCM 24511]|nr:hypothetical protein JCM24511_00954 [Saitozyma sp. JCM 24511]
MEALSRREENDVQEAARNEAMKACDPLVRDFADCCAGRTFTMPFACRSRMKAMHKCMRDYMTEERMDSMKLDYIANRSEKGKQAVEALREQRTSHLRKHYGRKEAETVPAS